MSPNSLAEYEGFLQHSGLLDEATLKSLQREFAQSTEPTQRSAQAFGEFLKSKGHLTSWQNSLLLKGRYKGFFLGKYKLLKQLGRGGTAGIYLAENPLLQRQDAIKVLPKAFNLAATSHFDRFQREAKALAKLDHPNIVRVYDIDEHEGAHFIVMEYVEGSDLEALVAQRGPLSDEEAADYIAQAAAGLTHAHQRHLIHRDVKPHNLLLDRTRTIKLLDLGLAQFRDEQTSLTTQYSDHLLGTADYISPEQALNSHDVDQQTDVYSLGCTLYFLLTGHPPFHEGTAAQRLAAHQSKQPPSIRAERARLRLSPVHPALEDICARMMAKAPSERLPSQEVEPELRAWLKRDKRVPPTTRAARPGAEEPASQDGGVDSAAPSNTLPTVTEAPLHTANTEATIEILSADGARPKPKSADAHPLPSRQPRENRRSTSVNSVLAVTGAVAMLLAGIAVVVSIVSNGGSETVSAEAPPSQALVASPESPKTQTNETLVRPTRPPDALVSRPVAPAAGEVRFYVVGNGKKYHRFDCQYVRLATSRARAITADEAKAKYQPCNKCTPDRPRPPPR
jgi:serine/threonine protein kinase